MAELNFKRTKLACYSAYFTMSSVFCLPPLLFVTFHNLYGVSWTLLGTLVSVNFITQLAIDLVFTFFSKKFNIEKVVKITPLITSLGLFVYALSPVIFPQNVYIGLLFGTVLFSVSAGLSEVLLSPIISAIPSKNAQGDMSFLHALYAFGVFSIVVIGSVFIKIFGSQNWMYLTAFFAVLPIIASVLFATSPIPQMSMGETSAKVEKTKKRYIGIALCVACIFFGSCAENVMSNWISSYMETQLGVDKAVGDILGMAVFAILLGITRITYAKRGKNINKMLLVGMVGAATCYLVAGLSQNSAAAFVACILTGAFTAMLWPGSLIMMEENIPYASVTLYALMAAGGDFGASVAPQLMGIVADEMSLKTGMLVSSVFAIAGAVIMLVIIRFFKKNDLNKT